MKRLFAAILGFCLVAAASAEEYLVTFGWTDPTTYQAGETPTYQAQWRLDGGAATTIADLGTPGGSFNLTASPGQQLEICPQSMNGALVNFDCTQPAHWFAAGTTQQGPTTPASPTGFSATIIYQGP